MSQKIETVIAGKKIGLRRVGMDSLSYGFQINIISWNVAFGHGR
jgi:hypothetical protein